MIEYTIQSEQQLGEGNYASFSDAKNGYVSRKHVQSVAESICPTNEMALRSPELMIVYVHIMNKLMQLSSEDILSIEGDDISDVGIAIHLGLMCD